MSGEQSFSKVLVGLIGEGIEHSLSPALHMVEASHFGLEYEYRILDQRGIDLTTDGLHELVRRARDDGFAALNITHPFKQRILPLLDELSTDAESVDAVNLVLFKDGRMIGHNTDWTGFGSAMQDGLPGVPLDRVVQVGTGGAGSATAYAALRLGVKQLILIDLDTRSASSLAGRYKAMFPGAEVRSAGLAQAEGPLSAATGVIQATPVGMLSHPGLSFRPEILNRDAWVAEVIYRPLETELLRLAAAEGHPVMDGGRMAVGQAVDSLRLITGIEPDVQRMRQHFLELVAAEQLETERAS